MLRITRGAAVLLLVGAALVMAPSVAGAIPAGNGCNATGVPAALISWYPAQPGAQSGLKMACTWNNNTGTSQVSASYTLHDHNMALWHNGAARTVTTSGVTAAGSATIQLSTASNGIAGLPVGVVNRVISGTGVGVMTHVRSMTAGGLLSLSRVTAASIPSGTTLKIENGIARSVSDATSGAPNLLNSVQASFAASDVGLSVSGTGIPANTTISSVNTPAQAVLSASFAFSVACPCQATIGETQVTTSTRRITGASTTSVVRINSSAAAWGASDVGLKVAGVCDQGTVAAGDDYTVPANTYILTVVSGANADTTGGLAVGQTGCNLTVGEPSATAPTDGDIVAHQGVQADLNPTLVTGAGDCSGEQPEGFTTIAKWFNPGSFQGAGVTSLQPGAAGSFQPTFPTAAIGQLFFDTAVGDASGFVIQKKALSTTPTGASDPIGVAHYDVIFPFLPTALGMCPGTATSPGLGLSLSIISAAASQVTLPSDTGRPGTAQLRSTLPSASGGYTSTAYVMSDNPAITYSPASAFNRLCVYPTGLPDAASFQCGPG